MQRYHWHVTLWQTRQGFAKNFFVKATNYAEAIELATVELEGHGYKRHAFEPIDVRRLGSNSGMALAS